MSEFFGEMRPGFLKGAGIFVGCIVAFFVLLSLWMYERPEPSRSSPTVSAAEVASGWKVQEEPEPMESGPLDVAIDFEHEMDSRGRLRIVGETNLPSGTNLMFSLGRRQDKGKVRDGRFESAWFGSKGGAGLADGVYEAGITVPHGNSHPDYVQRRLGTGLEQMTGPLTRMLNPEFEILGKVASIEREIQVGGSKKREHVDYAYWIDPGRHFAWSNLEFAPTSVQGVLTVTGRLKNVGEKDASKVHLKISMRNAEGREVGRGNVNKYDGLESGESWWFDGLMTVREPGGVEIYMGPENIVAFGY